jgi:hypothetical protein
LNDLQVIRDVAERERYWNLDEQTNRCKGITGQRCKSKAIDERWRVGIESSLRTIVAECNKKMNPHAPMCELECGLSNSSTLRSI